MKIEQIARKWSRRKYSSEYILKKYIRAKESKSIVVKYCSIYQYIRLQREFNAEVPLRIEWRGKPNFPHGLSGIHIAVGTIIGSNCTIFQQVTIGASNIVDSKGFGIPIIGDNCYIGAGAKVIGNITIGNNVRIGAGCVVTTDIPDNCTVVMEHPRIIVRETGLAE